jgi:hypothetical protein
MRLGMELTEQFSRLLHSEELRVRITIPLNGTNYENKTKNLLPQKHEREKNRLKTSSGTWHHLTGDHGQTDLQVDGSR